MTNFEATQKGVTVVATVPGQGKILALSGLITDAREISDPNVHITAPYGNILLFGSTNMGTNWTLVDSTVDPNSTGIWSVGIHFSPINSDVFWINGGYYKTLDGGKNFAGANKIYQALPTLGPLEIGSPNTNNMDKGSESMSFSADGQTILLTPHESYDLFKSTNGGTGWTNIGTTLPSGIAFPSYPLVIDANTYLIGCSFTVNGTWNTSPVPGAGTPGIYRTENGGQTWSLVSASLPSGFMPSGSPLVVNGKIYWSYFTGSDGGMLTSIDGGKTWTAATSSTLNYWVNPVLMPNGLIATLTSSGFVATSTNGSPPWTTIGPAVGLNDLRGMVYDSVNKGFLVWQRNGAVRRLIVN